jgi:DNA-binding NarL/FixJ family response regulator
LFLAFLVFLLFYQRKRRKAIELTAEINIQKLEKEKQEEVLDAKTREIATYSILVSNKNQLLKQVMELSNQSHNNKEATAKIHKIINENLDIDEEWDNFKLHFDKVHPQFFEKLKNTCSDLTEENLKMCAYLKIGMSNKQIAQLLHIEYNSVVVSKGRIKDKLKLEDDETLQDFIRKL